MADAPRFGQPEVHPPGLLGRLGAFKALALVLSRTRNRTLDEKVDKHWQVVVNQKQLLRGRACHG